MVGLFTDISLRISLDYRALRIAIRDFHTKILREVLDTQCKRVTPRESMSYITSSTAVNLFNTYFAEVIRDSSNVNNRNPDIVKSFDKSKTKTGKQSLKNRLTTVVNKIQTDWIELCEKDIIKRMLETMFFNF